MTVAHIAPARTADVLWFLPTHGDGRYLGTTIGAREVTLPYLRQVAQAADDAGYFGALLPTGRSCEDSWVVASALVPLTERLRFLVAVRPGLTLPAAAARMAATLDRMSGGRLLINVVTGGDPVELKGDGIFSGHAERYAVTAEFLEIWRRLMRGEAVDYKGEHLAVEDSRLFFPPVQSPYPPLYFGGSSEPGMRVAGEHCDMFLTWGEAPAQVAEKLRAAATHAASFGRKLRFGIRLHVIVRETAEEAWIVRETAEEAWAEADRLISRLDDATVAMAQQVFARMDSEGQRRMASLHGGRRENLEISPNLWAGVGLVRGGAGTALVGDPETVALRMREYMELGIDSFILSGYPNLEECYRFAELVLPHLPLNPTTGRPDRARARGNVGPFGEMIANADAPPVVRARAQS